MIVEVFGKEPDRTNMAGTMQVGDLSPTYNSWNTAQIAYNIIGAFYLRMFYIHTQLDIRQI